MGMEDVKDKSIGSAFPELFGEGPLEFTHMWSTCTLFQLQVESRSNVFENFATIATEDAKLVIDDAYCPNEEISEESQASIYDRLLIDKLWSYDGYLQSAKDSGFSIEVDEDLTSHLVITYNKLEESARQHGLATLADSYKATANSAQ